MANPFTARRPWAAAITTFLFSPVMGMLYLGRGAWALFYLAAMVLLAVTPLVLFPAGLASFQPIELMRLAEWLPSLAGVIHAYVLARRWDTAVPLRWYAHWYAVLGITAAPLALAFGLRTFVYQPFNMPTGSMSPTLNIGDYFFASKFAYDSSPPQRGDVVIFRNSGGAPYVKRIVGLPGEHIQMRAGVLFVDGVAARQRRVADWTETDLFGSIQHVSQYRETLPGGRTDLILDRGTTDMDNTAMFAVPADSYFVLGDNRDNSDDSRLNIGYVARDRILGRAAFKFAQNGRWAWKPIN